MHLSKGEDVESVGSTTVLCAVSSTRHVALTAGKGSRNVRVTAVAFTSILETRNREALRLTEIGTGLDGHVVTGDGSTSEQSTVDFLNTSSVGVCARRRSFEVRVGVDLESVGSSTSGRGRASTWGNTLSASARERSPVGQSIGAITLPAVLNSGVLAVSTEGKALLDGHVIRSGRLFGESSARDFLHTSGGRPTGGESDSLGSKIAVEAGGVGLGRDVKRESGGTTTNLRGTSRTGHGASSGLGERGSVLQTGTTVAFRTVLETS